MRHGRILLAGLLLACSREALAQSVGQTAPAVYREDPAYSLQPNQVGPFAVSTTLDAALTYDSNIYALPENEVDDVVFEADPTIVGTLASGGNAFRLDLLGQLRVRRYFDNAMENAEGATLRAASAWQLSDFDHLGFAAQWNRAIEDRGDPEARTSTDLGPRLYDIYSVEGGYSRRGARYLLAADLELRETDARSPLDAERDFTSYAGSLTGGVRVGTMVFATVSGFASKRDFRISRTPADVRRDTTTYGARAGLSFDPGGLIEGDISVGVFSLDPADPDLDERTGFSATGLISYRPQRRTALTLEVFSGDVATFRQGATARTDRRVLVGVQQEIRHNLYAGGRVGWRRTDYLGTEFEEDTLVGDFELEFLVSRHASVATSVSYGTRDSDIIGEDFDRFRAGAEVRLRF
jgi:hypothetical protein